MIDTVLKLLRKGRSEAEGLDIFSSLLFASTLEQSLVGLDNDRLARFASEAFAFIQRKTHKRHSINIRQTDMLAGVDAQGLLPTLSSASVIEILNDDMPYVVESVTGEIHSRGLSPILVFHPIFKVKRYGSGRLTAVVGPGDSNWASGDQESYMAVVLDRLDEAATTELVAALDAVLDDVRAATADADAMRARLAQAITAYEALPLSIAASADGLAPADVKEAIEFLKWLSKGNAVGRSPAASDANFTLLGMRDYEFVGTEQAADLWPVTNGALGVLKAPEIMVLRRGAEQLQITPEIRSFYASPVPLIISKASARSRVRDRAHLDYIGIKRYGPNNTLVGELRVVGLFTPAAYLQPVEAVPGIRNKVNRVLALAQFPPDSHSGRTLSDILETFPRDELFQIDPATLQSWSMALLDLSLRPRTRVLARRDSFNRYYSVLVFVARDVYSSVTRERIGRYLAETFNGRIVAYSPFISTSPLVRIHFIVSLGRNEPRDVPDAVLEHDVGELLRTWNDRLTSALAVRLPDRATAYTAAFPAGYAEMFPVERAVEDITRIERLGPSLPVAIDFYREAGAPAGRIRAAIYRFDAPIPLSERVPLLENMGFRVIDERSYRVHPRLAGVTRDVVLHDMVLETADGLAINLAGHDRRMEDCFLAVFHGAAEDDAFNALVLAADLDWREAAVFRALAAYLRQIRAPFSPRYVAETLVRHGAIARELFELFRARFDPDQLQSASVREAATAELGQRIESALAEVASLEEDRILRRMLNLVMATLRTNVFTARPGDPVPATIAFKLDSKAVDGLPEPKPFREIFVSSPRVEGIHLRFAAIARGGIRWSDRPQDFRTEVLGLAKAQQVKNTVIVPTGAKGGFVPRQHRRGNIPVALAVAGQTRTREEIANEGIAAYRVFIETLLSLTDNIETTSSPGTGGSAGRIVKPERIVCHDGDDPYLVVAADKGTATFSDDANEIAITRRYWLGDAFASGGSSGYDHKKIAITARGAWECVKRHFRELDIDIQVTPFRVIGVGDMSGDVFGNGMLLSPATQLIAAFDHRDIFLDPTPDRAASFVERKRLFDLPRSSWQDYDRGKISTGGGVHSRAAKSVALSPQVQAMLGMTAAEMTVTELTPAELIQALLRSETDLLWFGGIGTFVRASTETDEQAGDRANDGLRITAEELRARVIGEGANLGMTQRARIEAASRGIRLNADFIDNSAGVNTSDEEVNIKIALAPAVAAGRLALAERNRMLEAMREDVAAAVLANNRQQALALSLAERTSRRDIALLGRLTRRLDERGLVSRRLEALPSGAEFAQRATTGAGMTRPELAVLLSWSKIALDADLLASPAPEDPSLEPLLLEYFPSAIRDKFAAEIKAHRLHREIIATRLTNSMINRGGPAFLERIDELLGEERTASPETVAHAFMTARAIFGMAEIWNGLETLDSRIAGQLQLELYQQAQDLLVEQTAGVLREQKDRSFAEMISSYRPEAEHLARTASAISGPEQRMQIDARARELTAAGLPDDLARRFSAFQILGQTIALADKARAAHNTTEDTARVMFGINEYLRLDDFRKRAAAVKLADEFDSLAVAEALHVIEGEHDALMQRMMQSGGGAPAVGTIGDVAIWIAANAPRLAAAKPIIDDVLSRSELTVSRLTVVADKLRGAAAGG